MTRKVVDITEKAETLSARQNLFFQTPKSAAVPVIFIGYLDELVKSRIFDGFVTNLRSWLVNLLE